MRLLWGCRMYMQGIYETNDKQVDAMLSWKDISGTHSVTVLPGRRLGCKVSNNSPRLHTTLIRIICLLGPFERSLLQLQLSMTKSGQFLFAAKIPNNPAINCIKYKNFIVDQSMSLMSFERLISQYFRDQQGLDHSGRSL